MGTIKKPAHLTQTEDITNMKKIVIFLLAAILLVTCFAMAEMTEPAAQPENEISTTDETVISEDTMAFEGEMIEEEFVGECPEVFFVSGYVMEVMEDGSLLILTNDGEEIVIHLHEETINEIEDIQPGQFIIADYNGMMTRSLPPQISAQHLYVYVMDGTVTEQLTEENAFLMETELQGLVMVRLPEGLRMPNVEENVRVYFNGVITLSLPGQINAFGMETIPGEMARPMPAPAEQPAAE